jgi:methylenetetrahydrofolate--tRNA-(uracil-5-)-methyltransferase
MAPNFGIVPDLGVKIKSKPEKYGRYRDRSLADLAIWRRENLPILTEEEKHR